MLAPWAPIIWAVAQADETDAPWPGFVLLGGLGVIGMGIYVFTRWPVPEGAEDPKELRTAGPSGPTAAGWYPDPERAATQRYWDGSKWSDHIAPMPAPQHGPSTMTIARGVALGVVVALIALYYLFGGSR